MIKNKIVYGGLELEIPPNLSIGKYVIDKLKEYRADKHKIVMIDEESQQELSYEQLLHKIVSIANGLKRLGLTSNDMVALYSENCNAFIAATVAAVSIGATVTTINHKYTNDELLRALNISKPTLIFCSEVAVATKLDILRQAWVKHIVQLEGVVSGEDVLPLADVQFFESNVEDYEPAPVCGAEDTAFVFYSSGTTGLPKGVMLTHRNVLHGLSSFNYTNKNKARVLTLLPWSHVYGLFTTIQYIVSGNLVVFLKNLKLDKYLTTIDKYQIAEMPVVPSIVALIANSPLVKKYDLSSVNIIWCAAAPISKDIIIRAKNNLPNCKGIYQGYGMTETTLSVFKEECDFSETSRNEGSCGMPLPGIVAKVIDVVTREKLGPKQHGEICMKGPNVMKGYVSNEAATRAMFDDEGYIKTGDVGYYDSDGRFYIVDRLKDIIKYKGHQVAPATVEAVILQHNEVTECAVVGTPDELAGELPTAFVVMKPGATLTAGELLEFTAARLSPISRIRGGVIFIEAIPRNVSGKVLRRELRNKLRGRKETNYK